jgi:glycosyltransferase involved in cell wall biosynthesis
MRIGIDCRLPYYRMGGISQYIIFLIQALAQTNAADEFLLFHSRKDPRSYVPPGDPRFRRVDLWTPCHHRWERRVLSLELAPHGLDVFHSPDFIPPAGGAPRRIITVHDLTFLHYPQFLTDESRSYYNDQIAWAVATADHISADSEATRRDILNLLDVPPDKVTTVLLAANPLYHSPAPAADVARTLSDLGLEAGYVLFVGTLEPRKNVPTLLNAMHRLVDDGRGAPLVLVGGKGWIYDDIFATIDSLGLRSSVRHLMGVADAQLQHLYQAAGVLASPSHYEGFGLPALEAMHSGCPVIAARRGSLPEIVGEAGKLLEPDDVPAWAAAIDRVLSDTAVRGAMIVKGYAQAERFQWSRTADQTLALYHGN